jgi:hypothetical protein
LSFDGGACHPQWSQIVEKDISKGIKRIEDDLTAGRFKTVWEAERTLPKARNASRNQAHPCPGTISFLYRA